MSIHKSQGSEFDDVAIVLPAEASPVLRRELLYTGVTRARKSAVVYGDPELLRACIEARSERASGLSVKLWSGFDAQP
jgi:exodeoxyribonuclease V alpha subunit